MRQKGRVKRWQDDKGFGFIEPCLPGPEVFLHIKAFDQAPRRPQIGDLLTYVVTPDERRRPRATQVRYSLAAPSTAPVREGAKRRAWAIPFALLVLLALPVATAFGHLRHEVIALYWTVSAATFFAYGWDKASAARKKWRTQESTLLVLGLIGGWPGALIAQEVLRHKTAKASFQAAFWLSIAVNLGALTSSLVWLGGMG